MKRDFYLVGLSHKTAPIAVRERVALSEESLKSALRALKAQPGVGEAFVVSTCNRVEVYVHADGVHEGRRFFLDRAPDAAAHLYEKAGGEAVRHLFRVAASLDSMVLGEPQILGQVKDAYGAAEQVQACGPFLSRAAHRAFATAKRIRTETEIARGAGNVSQVAVELVQKIFGDLRGRAILLVGAGKMGRLSAKALAGLGADQVLVTNRSADRAQKLSAQVGGQARPWEELVALLALADVVLVSTGAPEYVVTRELAAQVMKARKHRSLCLIDLAVPRNVDPRTAELGNVYAYDMDDLEKVVRATHETRAGEAVRAEAIVEAELMAFLKEREERAALPVLAALRRQAEQIARAEAERTLEKIGGELKDEKVKRSIQAMATAIVNKLLHAPTARLKDAAASGDSQLPGIAAELFGVALDAEPEPEPAPAPQAATVVSLAERKG